MQRIEAHMKAFMGLHGSTIGDDMVSQAVDRRIAALDLSDGHRGAEGRAQQLDDYLLLLQQSTCELAQLSELLVVPETWFFRYQKSFDFIRQHALDWLHEYGRPLSILSLPCATGEEPYSIAMCLLDAGLSPDSFHIDAVDISNQALESAKRAEYGENSFRSDDVGFRQRYCTQHGDVYQVNARVRSSVHFSHYNIMQAGNVPGGPYALVFCRNLLIYFDPPTQQQVLKKISHLLYSDGLFFTGHGDTGAVRLCGDYFESVDNPAFVFRNRSHEDRLPEMIKQRQQSERLQHLDQMHPVQSFSKPKTLEHDDTETPSSELSASVFAKPAIALPEVTLSIVREQADREQLFEAEDNCQRYLRTHGADADGWSLLGVIQAAQGRQAEALKALHKAVYLDVAHEEALIHLALLADQMGQTDVAARFRQRLNRIMHRQGSAL